MTQNNENSKLFNQKNNIVPMQFSDYVKRLMLIVFCVSSLALSVIYFLKEEAFLSVTVNLSVRNNLWTHYGNKSLKSKLYELEKNNFVMNSIASSDEGKQAVLKTLINNLDSEITRYKQEQNNIQQDAFNADTRYEISKKKYLIYLVLFCLSLLATVLSAFLLCFAKLNQLIEHLAQNKK